MLVLFKENMEKYDTHYCQVQDWKKYLCMFLSSTPNTNILNVVGHAQNIVHQILHSSNFKKERADSLYFPEEKQIGMFYK